MRLVTACLLLSCTLVCFACISPPEKEMNQARGAIEAAKAAGAEQYAPDEYKAAVGALKRSEEAVDQRDYRQALNSALDSREQAQNAARTAANQKAVVRSQAERELNDLQPIVAQAQARLKAAETTRAKRRALQADRRAIEDAEASVQKARAAMSREDYIGAREAIQGVSDKVRAAINEIDRAAESPVARRRR